MAAGRTDAGVHALAQVAHLRALSSPLSAKDLQYKLNTLLPVDINVTSLQTASAHFHARHDALTRYYIYQISQRRTAFAKPYVWWVRDRLQLPIMIEACKLMLGKQNFQSFCEREGKERSTLVKVVHTELAVVGSLILFRIAASHFLWKMVRRLVGTLVELGRGNITLKDLQKMLIHFSPQPAAWTAPPSGLFLERIIYPGDTPPDKLTPAFAVN